MQLQEEIIKSNIVDFLKGFDYTNLHQLLEMHRRLTLTMKQLSWYIGHIERQIYKVTYPDATEEEHEDIKA